MTRSPIPAVALAAALLLGCGELPAVELPDLPGGRDDAPAWGTHWEIDGGNLADVAAVTPEERTDAMARFLVEHRDELGAETIAPERLTFAPRIDEQRATFNGEPLATTILVQTVDDAMVIESIQYGAWTVLDDGTSELRRLRAMVSDPEVLPEAPHPPDPGILRDAQATLAVWLRSERGIVDGTVRMEGAAISERLGVAGYLARWTRTEDDGALSRMVLLVDPEIDEVHVVDDMPACHAGASTDRRETIR